MFFKKKEKAPQWCFMLRLKSEDVDVPVDNSLYSSRKEAINASERKYKNLNGVLYLQKVWGIPHINTEKEIREFQMFLMLNGI